MSLRRLFGNVIIGLFAAWLSLSTPFHVSSDGDYHLHADTISVGDHQSAHPAAGHTHGQPPASTQGPGEYQPALVPAIPTMRIRQVAVGESGAIASSWSDRSVSPMLQPPTLA